MNSANKVSRSIPHFAAQSKGRFANNADFAIWAGSYRPFQQLLKRFDDVFFLPAQHASGAAFCGAVISDLLLENCSQSDLEVSVAGRGLDARQALLGCIGEAAEYLSFLEREIDPLTTFGDTESGLDGRELEWCLSAAGVNARDQLKGRDWCAVINLLDGGHSKVPADCVLRRIPESRAGLEDMESTGLAAGAHLEEAALSGLMEVIERDAFAMWWRAGVQVRRFSEKSLEDYGLMNLARTVRRRSWRKWWALNTTTDLGIPSVACVSCEPSGKGVVVGLSASLDATAAVQAAFLEMCQMELSREISLRRSASRQGGKMNAVDRRWVENEETVSLERFPELRGVDLTALLQSPMPPDPLAAAVRSLRERGYTAYCADLTRAELGIPVCRVVVPGLQLAKSPFLTDRLREHASCAESGVYVLDSRPFLL